LIFTVHACDTACPQQQMKICAVLHGWPHPAWGGVAFYACATSACECMVWRVSCDCISCMHPCGCEGSSNLSTPRMLPFGTDFQGDET
jgi:hypothetical protein